MISEEDISRIEEATDIVDLIGEYMDLKKKGTSFEGCCPFHNEKTPSFKVNPAKGIFKCFGCGKAGDAVKFVMLKDGLSYPEALRKLAKRANIEIREKPKTADEIAHDTKCEQMMIYNLKVNEFFVSQLAINPAAKKYAVGRWGEEYVEKTGIGYAPAGNAFIEWAKKECLSIDLLKELHLIGENAEGGIYSMFRERVTIPQRSRTNVINGWTCRDVSHSEKAGKYMNSSDSEIYHKASLLFGIDVARPAVKTTGKCYIAEGAPDVMRMQIIGVPNAMAPLGTGTLGESQFELLAKCYPTMGQRYLCILPDCDVDKADGTNPGRETAIRIGKEACKRGYVVSVKEIPDTITITDDKGREKNVKRIKKADPDDYFVSIDIFNETEEKDFISWYAEKKFTKATSSIDVNAAVNEIATLLAAMDDDVRVEGYLKSLKSLYKESSVWNKALKKAKEERLKKQVEEKASQREETMKYGFYESNRCYWAMKGSTEVRWSNFVMKPLFHIEDQIYPKRLYMIENINGDKRIVEMKQDELSSIGKFRQRVEGLGNFVFRANEDCLMTLKEYLYEKTETATEIVQLGWQKWGGFAFGNGILFQGQFIKADHFGIVRLEGVGNYYLPGASEIYKDDLLMQFEKRFVHLNYSTVTMSDVAKAMINVFGNNAKVGLCFLIATLFRDVITAHVKAFPLLNLFGPKGSGKSELGHTLMSFFIIQNIPPNLSNSTIAALSEVVAQCANALVHIDEFKNNIEREKIEFLKGLWDSAGRSRMNMDRDKKREQTRVDSGVIISGQEMATADIALFSRFIYLTFNKTEFSTNERNNFTELDRLRKFGFTHLTIQILNHRESFKQKFPSYFNLTNSEIMTLLGEEICESRIVNNWCTIAAAFRTIEKEIDVPFPYEEILEICVDGIKRQNKECKSNNEIAAFWNVISFLQQEGKLNMDGDYRINYEKIFKTNKGNFENDKPKPMLLLRKNRAFQLYKEAANRCGEKPLPESSLKYYLENSKEYLGIKNSVRFKVFVNGQEKQVNDPAANRFVSTTMIDQAMCFDYEMLMTNMGINLEIDGPVKRNSEDDLPFNIL